MSPQVLSSVVRIATHPRIYAAPAPARGRARRSRACCWSSPPAPSCSPAPATSRSSRTSAAGRRNRQSGPGRLARRPRRRVRLRVGHDGRRLRPLPGPSLAAAVLTASLAPTGPTRAGTPVSRFGPWSATPGGQPGGHHLEVLDEAGGERVVLPEVLLAAAPGVRGLQDLARDALAALRHVEAEDRVLAVARPRRARPPSAAFRSLRVWPMLMRLPTPKGPPVQPVLTSQQVAPCCSIFFRSRSA